MKRLAPPVYLAVASMVLGACIDRLLVNNALSTRAAIIDDLFGQIEQCRAEQLGLSPGPVLYPNPSSVAIASRAELAR